MIQPRPARRRVARRRAIGAGLLLALAGWAPPSRAQDDGEPTLRFTGEEAVSWVLVPTVVRHGAHYVPGLTERDFRLWVDERAVAIQGFGWESDAPVSLVYLQDLSGSMANGGKLAASREALRYFLGRAAPGDEIALATFASERTRVEVPFTGDLTALEQALSAWQGYGTTALHDAVAWLPEIQVEGRNRKRVAVLVTDGLDNASTLSAATARDMVRRSRLPVYVVELGDRPTAAAAPAPETPPAGVLSLLAAASGGVYTLATDPDQVKEACVTIAEDVRHQYVLSFPTRPGPERQHRIRVEVPGREGLEILHRAAYQGPPPAAP